MTDEKELFVAQIIHDGTREVVFTSKPTSKRRAEKIEDGAGINLNWEEYSTRVVPAEGGDE